MAKYVFYGALVILGLIILKFVCVIGVALAPMLCMAIIIIVGLYVIGVVAEKMWLFVQKLKSKKDDDVIITPPPREKEHE